METAAINLSPIISQFYTNSTSKTYSFKSIMASVGIEPTTFYSLVVILIQSAMKAEENYNRAKVLKVYEGCMLEVATSRIMKSFDLINYSYLYYK